MESAVTQPPPREQPSRTPNIDPALYDQLLNKENEIWSKMHTDQHRAGISAEDQVAARTLRLNRDSISLANFAKKNGIRWKMGLSLGCGEGRFERQLLEADLCEQLDAIDIAEASVASGARIAAEKNLPIAYGVQDLNCCTLAPGKYDLVAAQTCLHHIVELEHLADQIHQSLQPDGYLWIHDFIGETKFQFVEERIRICNDLLNILPPEFRVDRFTDETLDAFERPHPDRLASPFEAIRSAEILPVFLERFEIVERSESNALLHIICPPGYRPNYIEQPNGQVIFNRGPAGRNKLVALSVLTKQARRWPADRSRPRRALSAPLCGSILHGLCRRCRYISPKSCRRHSRRLRFF